jgi:hypothetical protein
MQGLGMPGEKLTRGDGLCSAHVLSFKIESADQPNRPNRTNRRGPKPQFKAKSNPVPPKPLSVGDHWLGVASYEPGPERG